MTDLANAASDTALSSTLPSALRNSRLPERWQWLSGYKHVTAAAVLTFGGLAVLLVVAALNIYSNLTLVLFTCGGAGSVVANYRRLAQLAEHDDLDDALTTTPVTLEFYLAPLMGGVFALVAAALFFSGLVEGSLFPKLEGTNLAYTSFHDLFVRTHPATFADAMKAIFWSFVAGYSKKFLPNTLDRLAETAAERPAKNPAA